MECNKNIYPVSCYSKKNILNEDKKTEIVYRLWKNNRRSQISTHIVPECPKCNALKNPASCISKKNRMKILKKRKSCTDCEIIYKRSDNFASDHLCIPFRTTEKDSTLMHEYCGKTLLQIFMCLDGYNFTMYTLDMSVEVVFKKILRKSDFIGKETKCIIIPRINFAQD